MKEIVVSPQCPVHGWMNVETGRHREPRPACVDYVEYSRDGQYIIREQNLEAAGLNA